MNSTGSGLINGATFTYTHIQLLCPMYDVWHSAGSAFDCKLIEWVWVVPRMRSLMYLTGVD